MDRFQDVTIGLLQQIQNPDSDIDVKKDFSKRTNIKEHWSINKSVSAQLRSAINTNIASDETPLLRIIPRHDFYIDTDTEHLLFPLDDMPSFIVNEYPGAITFESFNTKFEKQDAMCIQNIKKTTHETFKLTTEAKRYLLESLDDKIEQLSNIKMDKIPIKSTYYFDESSLFPVSDDEMSISKLDHLSPIQISSADSSKLFSDSINHDNDINIDTSFTINDVKLPITPQKKNFLYFDTPTLPESDKKIINFEPTFSEISPSAILGLSESFKNIENNLLKLVEEEILEEEMDNGGLYKVRVPVIDNKFDDDNEAVNFVDLYLNSLDYIPSPRSLELSWIPFREEKIPEESLQLVGMIDEVVADIIEKEIPLQPLKCLRCKYGDTLDELELTLTQIGNDTSSLVDITVDLTFDDPEVITIEDEDEDDNEQTVTNPSLKRQQSSYDLELEALAKHKTKKLASSSIETLDSSNSRLNSLLSMLEFSSNTIGLSNFEEEKEKETKDQSESLIQCTEFLDEITHNFDETKNNDYHYEGELLSDRMIVTNTTYLHNYRSLITSLENNLKIRICDLELGIDEADFYLSEKVGAVILTLSAIRQISLTGEYISLERIEKISNKTFGVIVIILIDSKELDSNQERERLKKFINLLEGINTIEYRIIESIKKDYIESMVELCREFCFINDDDLISILAKDTEEELYLNQLGLNRIASKFVLTQIGIEDFMQIEDEVRIHCFNDVISLDNLFMINEQIQNLRGTNNV